MKTCDVKKHPTHVRSQAFPTRKAHRRWWILFIAMCLLGFIMCLALLMWANPVEPGTRAFWLIVQRRSSAVIAMLIVAVSQAMATIAFQTVAANRIITPSILGFESLYRAIHTSTIFFLGVSGLVAARTHETFVGTLILMVAMCLLLYSWLLTSKYATLHAMLLLGVVIGAGLGSISTLMQRLLTPSEFDVLTARLFGSVNNASDEYYPIAITLVLICAGGLFLLSPRLNIMSLGREMAITLGVNHRKTSILVLILVSVLMATSTALVGPMTFLGFMVATLTYQFSGTFDHRRLFAMAIALGVVVLTSAYFIMNHIFNAQGVVSLIIEFIGGLTFIIVILKKGRL
ncbi:iron chelate uptake ABC transporter family permease subunit [Schaalia sp. lx-260]|uniref:iron chelate uptake ABC transporter family permease subunit n=1 Tax=Schaalia sp. lx-260 TaxID=2899082 RepID=UPI001E56782B|nr:iron chelate uptake ABC transporter family permease subunit [Schaalia sp. lx-260]MCD4549536.1 iron chelate uptake ABC transporter family permease subunit [Schaalia sp. lx-260]